MKFQINFLIITMMAGANAALANSSGWLEVNAPLQFHQSGDSLEVLYSLPCGAEFVGVAARHRGDQPLEVGIVVRRRPVMCVSMPQVKLATLRHIRNLPIRAISPMRPGAKGRSRLRFSEMVDLKAVREGKHRVLQTVFESRCANVVAAVLNTDIDGVTKVGVIEEHATNRDCRWEQRAGALRFMDVPSQERLQPFDLGHRDLYRAYDLRLAPVVGGSLGVNHGALAATYERRCNESPIGIVVSRPVRPRAQASAQVPEIRVGVLVARFYNMDCSPAQPKHVIETITQNNVSLPQGFNLVAMQETRRMGMFTVRSAIDVTSGKGGRGLSIEYYGSCDREVGGIYSTDVSGQPVSAVLMRRQRTPCERPARRLRLTQPLSFADTSQSGNIYPMRLEGFRYIF